MTARLSPWHLSRIKPTETFWSPRGYDKAVILLVVHFKYIVQAACAFTPIDANEAAWRENVFLLAHCTNIVMIRLGITMLISYTKRNPTDSAVIQFLCFQYKFMLASSERILHHSEYSWIVKPHKVFQCLTWIPGKVSWFLFAFQYILKELYT